jgi:hypothetical protein
MACVLKLVASKVEVVDCTIFQCSLFLFGVTI